MKQKTQKKTSLRPKRTFSEVVKKQMVASIENGKCTVLEVSRELGTHEQTIYRWIYRYSRYLSKNKVMVVEDKSEGFRTKELEKQLKEAQAALGRKQMELDFLNKLIELASAEYKTDLKKNLINRLSAGSKSLKEKGTDTQ
jgi:transposase-like protein